MNKERCETDINNTPEDYCNMKPENTALFQGKVIFPVPSLSGSIREPSGDVGTLPLRRRLYGDAILNCLGSGVEKAEQLLVMVSMKEMFPKFRIRRTNEVI